MIGKTVWTIFGNHSIRFGTVVEEGVKGAWTYVRVNWVDDDAFEMDRQRVVQMRGSDRYSDWYRIDRISVFDKTELIKTVNKL
jgi:hypothetical protein